MRGSDRQERYTQPEVVPTRRMVEHPSKPGVYLPVHCRPLRLPGVDYAASDCLCFVTFNLERTCPVRFTGPSGCLAWDVLCDELERIGCAVFAACLMPDHVHLLVAPSGHGETISDIVRRVKTRTYTDLRSRHNICVKWQPSFYDHILRSAERSGEVFDVIVHYIRANPANAGLGDDYPFRR